MSLRTPIRRTAITRCALAAVLAGAVLATVAACGDGPRGKSETATGTGAALSGSITVFAAASLTDAFKDIGKQFERDNPGTKVAFSFAGSSALATQINEGAPADVFASADTKQMKVVTDKGESETPVNFATNVPVVVVPSGDTKVKSFEDLAKPGIKLVLAAPTVPIGNYARTILANATGRGGVSATFSEDVLKNLVSNETDVKAVLAKIQVGEADAGVVYTTDAATVKKDARTIAIPEKYNVVAHYPLAAMKTSKNLDVAEAFVRYVTSEMGQAILKQYGFGGAG